eukprot:Awhi_evm1s11251
MKNIRLTGETYVVNSVLSKFEKASASDGRLVGGSIKLVGDYFTIEDSTGYASDISDYLLPSV